MKDKTIVKNEDVWIPTFCLQCDMGPELIKVHRVNGTAIKVEGNNNLKDIIPYGPLSCVKSHGLIQKVYNPERIKAPMKRTNPQKGKDIDPGWVEISWDEALNIVADKLKAIRKKGLIDENGYPRLAMTFGGGGSAASWMGTAYYAFMNAWGPIERGLGASTGVKCGHTEHAYAEFWHRGFLANADFAHRSHLP